MNNKSNITEFRSEFQGWDLFQYWALLCVFACGLILSIISGLNLCTSECTETKSYLLFGLPFVYVGLAFFSVAILLHLFSKYYLPRLILAALLVGALGSEMVFIWIQKYQIGTWCPICLSIFGTIVLAGAIFLIGSIIHQQQLGQPMKTIKNILSFIPVFLIGLLVALVGISKPDHQLIAMDNLKEKIELGDAKSPIEVYFITDWFCSACRKVEPVMQQLAPGIMKQAGFFFIDHAVNPETVNYSPYNLSFLIHNKANYFKIREALIRLSKKNKSPKDEAIKKAIAPLGEKLTELNYADIKAGTNFFDEISKKYDVKATPTLVIVNTKTNEVRQLKGESGITEANINEAIQAVKEEKSEPENPK